MIVMIWPLVPVAGSIISSALQRSWARKDLDAQNLYNSPEEQIKRLRKAGLPLATMFGGQGGSTSEQPRTTEVDPTLGTAKGLEVMFQNRLQKAQLALIAEQVRKAQAEADLAESDRDWQLKESQNIMYPGTGQMEKNQVQQLEMQKEQKNLDRLLMRSNVDIKGIEYRVQKDLEDDGTLTAKTRMELDRIVQEIARTKQLIEGSEPFIKMKQKFFSAIENSPSGITDLKSIIYMVLASVISSFR